MISLDIYEVRTKAEKLLATVCLIKDPGTESSHSYNLRIEGKSAYKRLKSIGGMSVIDARQWEADQLVAAVEKALDVQKSEIVFHKTKGTDWFKGCQVYPDVRANLWLIEKFALYAAEDGIE